MKKVTRILSAVVMVIAIAAVIIANTTGGVEFINDVMLACTNCMIDYADALACTNCMIDPLNSDIQLS